MAWLSLSCGSWGQANGLPHDTPLLDAMAGLVSDVDAVAVGSLSHERGPWKWCGRHTCGEVTCELDMRDAVEGREKIAVRTCFRLKNCKYTKTPII